MTDYAKGIAIALGRRCECSGSRGRRPATHRINPYNSPYDAFDRHPGARARRAYPPSAHERQHELLFCYRGSEQADMGQLRRRPEAF